jgi:RNA polymerase sigma-70 factor (ECF subfamily)
MAAWSNTKGIRAGAPADKAIASLVEQHAPKIRALALRLCRSPEDADDAVQDTFLQAFRKWDHFRGGSDPATWLYTIAVRVCRRRMRRRAGQAARMPSLAELAPFSDSTVADPADAPLDKESLASLQNAIVKLPEPFRLAIVLKDILDLPTEDVAAVLGIKNETVKTRSHRARLLLRKSLMEHVDQKPAPEPLYERQVCYDLLRAKLDAMDKGRGFPLRRNVICERCRAVFAELDLTQLACGSFAGPHDDLPPSLKEKLRAILAPAVAPRAAKRSNRSARRAARA